MVDIRLLITRIALVAGGASAVTPASRSAMAQSEPQADRIIATITHPTLGAVPPAPCATSPVVSSFQETTPATGQTQGGAFAVEIQSTCIAAFVQAAMQGSRMSAQFAYMSGNTPVTTYTLTNAFIGEVDFGLRQNGSSMAPIVRIQIAAPQVSVTYPKNKDGAVAQTAKTAAPTRSKAPAFQLRALPPAATSGEAWATGGVHATLTVATDNPAMNVTFPVTDFHVNNVIMSIAWIHSNNQLVPAPSNVIAAGHSSDFLNFTKTIDGSTGALHTAAQTHQALKTATLTLTGARGTAGITVSTFGVICSDQVNGSNETLAFAGSVTITDAGSGRKVVFQPGRNASGAAVSPLACT